MTAVDSWLFILTKIVEVQGSSYTVYGSFNNVVVNSENIQRMLTDPAFQVAAVNGLNVIANTYAAGAALLTELAIATGGGSSLTISGLAAFALSSDVATSVFNVYSAYQSGDGSKFQYELNKLIFAGGLAFSFLAAGAGAPAAAVAWTLGQQAFDWIESGNPPFPLSSLFGVLQSALEATKASISPLLKDPLILDLDGDGIELISLANSNAHLDYGGDGFAERTGWVKGDDGILVFDRNANGAVDGIGEMFGSATQDGFEVLQTLDTNRCIRTRAPSRSTEHAARWLPAMNAGMTDCTKRAA